jgi:hypothetical protein
MRGGIVVLTIHRYDGATGGDRREPFRSVSHHQAELTAKTVNAARAVPVVDRRSTSRAGSAVMVVPMIYAAPIDAMPN